MGDAAPNRTSVVETLPNDTVDQRLTQAVFANASPKPFFGAFRAAAWILMRERRVRVLRRLADGQVSARR